MAEVLLTGYPSFVARQLCARLVEAGDSVRLLVQHRYADAAARFVSELEGPGRATPLIGDVVLMDLGLTGPQVRELLHEVEIVYHMATVSQRSRRFHRAQEIHVDGTRSILDLALGAGRLRRFVFLSTAFVSGDRRGVVLEEELERGQSFRDEFQRTKYEAELRVRRAGRDIPISVMRPSLMVGDSRTGEADVGDDPYHMMLAFLNVPFDVPIPLPGRGDYPLHLVPVDYVVRAMHHIATDPRGVGRTFHLTDPNPLPAARVLDLIADVAQRRRPRGAIPPRLARQLLNLPWMNAAFGAPPSQVVDWFEQLVIYNTTNTLELLNGTEIACPPFASYVANLVAHLRAVEETGPATAPADS